jgi:hypothetical protein
LCEIGFCKPAKVTQSEEISKKTALALPAIRVHHCEASVPSSHVI